MEYNEVIPALATQKTPLRECLQSLALAFEQLPDPRKLHNKTYRLSSLLLALTAAILCNHLSVLACAEWLADQSLEVKQALGFDEAEGKTPHQSTFARAFKQLEVVSLEKILSDFFEAQSPPPAARARGSQCVAIDGKCQRGRLAFEPTKGTPCHLLSAFCQELGTVLAQTAIVNKEAELTVVSELVEQLDWTGRVLTGDAIFCQRKLCRQVIERGGDYLFVVKGNQKQLKAGIVELFEPPSAAELERIGWAAPVPLLIEKGRQPPDKDHGRIEIRHIAVSSELNSYSDWPGLAQVFSITREWCHKGVWKSETHFGLTSLPAELASPQRLLAIRRGHWGIENKLHWVRDEVLGEDASTLHVGSGPQVLSAIRNTVLSLLRRAGQSQIKAALRRNSRQPHLALALLGISLPSA